jgi:uncharacterized protein YkwD
VLRPIIVMPAMKENSRIWWYKGTKDNHSFVRGPFTWEEILQRLQNEVISENTMVKRSADVFWQELAGRLHDNRRSFGLPIAAVVCLAVALFFLYFYAYDNKPEWYTTGRPGAKASTDTGRSPGGSNVQSSKDEGRLSPHQPAVSRGDVQLIPQEPLTRDAIIRLGNDTRAFHGFGPLAENQLLNKIAEERLRDMFQKQYIGHVSPTGEQASDSAQRAGYQYKIIAENIASGNFLNNQKVIDGWMQSPGHRQNVLSPDTKEIGVAVDKGFYRGAGTWIAVQIFGLQSAPVSARKRCIPPSQDLHAEIESKRTELMNLNNRLLRFKEELDQETSAIESDRRNIAHNAQATYNLNLRINAHNEKSTWYNDSLADLMAKRDVVKSMVEDYNKRVKAYQDCESSGN